MGLDRRAESFVCNERIAVWVGASFKGSLGGRI